jgi:hypothetical protein
MRKLLLLTFAILLFSCNNKYLDVSNINVDYNIIRFDSILFSNNVDSIDNFMPKYLVKYPDFIETYTSGVISVGNVGSRDFNIRFKEFIAYTSEFEIDKAVKNQFSDFENVKLEINDALKYYKYYFPKQTIPDIYTYISGFNQSVIVGNNFIGVGLDKYLGANSNYYIDLNMPNYIRYKTDKRFIPVDVIRALAYYNFDFPENTNTLLSKIIYEGKIQFFVDKMFPTTEDSTKIAYNTSQIEWCEKNEKEVWTWLIENKKLFSTDFKEIRSFVGESPFTVELSKDAPGRIGIWIGWQIVKKYMENNPKITIEQLMKDNDFQGVLNNAKYNP